MFFDNIKNNFIFHSEDNVSGIVQGDCLEVMQFIPYKSVDLILTDLPYGTTKCDWDNIISFPEMWKSVNKVIKENKAIVFNAQQPFTSLLITSNIKNYKYSWVWEKSKATGFLNSKKRPLVSHEDVVVFSKKTPPYYPIMTEGKSYNKGIRKQQTENDVYGKFNQKQIKSDGLRYPRTVLYFKTAETEGKTFHKTQKPLELIKYLIQTYTRETDIVLDFTMGSGTTCLAAKELNRKFIGIEKEEKYFEIAKKRIYEL